MDTNGDPFKKGLQRPMNRIEEKLAYQEKEDIDREHEMAEGKRILAVWLNFRMRALKKAGWSDTVVLQDMQYEIQKAMR